MRLLPFIFALLFWHSAGAADPVWEARIRQLEQLGLPYFYNDDVQANIDAWLKNDNNATSRIAGYHQAYAPAIDQVRKTHGLPWFVTYLPAANTGFNPLFVDTDGSTGMWPLNFTMGKKYGLRQNSLLDERRSFDRSAVAACLYLKDLNGIYKDWLKTITAFRIGAVRLNQVIRLSGNSLQFTDIYSHLTPAEKTPVVQFYAAVVVLYYLGETDLKPTAFTPAASDTVSVKCTLPMTFFEQKTGVTAAELKQLNPAFKGDVIPWFGEPAVVSVPAARVAEINRVNDSLCLWLDISTRPPVIYDTIIKVVDSVTYVEVKPRTGRGPEPVVTPGPARPVTPAPRPQPQAPTYIWVYYKVKSGDGFYTLSDVFDCTTAQLKSWNGIRNNMLIAGTTLKFYVPASKKAYYQQINYMTQAQKRNVAQRD